MRPHSPSSPQRQRQNPGAGRGVGVGVGRTGLVDPTQPTSQHCATVSLVHGDPVLPPPTALPPPPAHYTCPHLGPWHKRVLRHRQPPALSKRLRGRKLGPTDPRALGKDAEPERQAWGRDSGCLGHGRVRGQVHKRIGIGDPTAPGRQ
jgi:hypothetical protein